jgi:choline-sulfatase
LDPQIPTIGRTLSNAGYDTHWIGKWHLGTQPTDHGWDRQANIHDTSNGRNALPTDQRTVDSAIDYLSESRENPFFLTISLNLPHPPYFLDDEFADRYDECAIDPPENFTDSLEDKPAFHATRAGMEECDLTPEEYRELRYRYRTMVSRMDHILGEFLDALAASPAGDETAVIYTSDHGDMQGAHGLNKKGVLAYEEILRVPLLVALPGGDTGRSTVSEPVSTISLPRTMASLADVPALPSFGGEDLSDRLDPTASTPQGSVFFEHRYAYWGDHPYRGIRDGDWKYVDYLTDSEAEVYDLENDPFEQQNLAEDSGVEDIRERLRTDLETWWTETDGDEHDFVTSPVP